MNHVKFEDGIARCGEPLDNSFHFKDIEQVIINNLHGERIACIQCVHAIISSLLTTPAQNGKIDN